MTTRASTEREQTPPDDILTVEEAAKALRVSTSTLRRRIRYGELPAYRMGGRRLWVRRGDLSSLMSPVHPAVNWHEDDDLDRPLTDEERERGLAALEAMATLSARMLAERRGILFSPSEDLIREAREERTRELSDLS